MLTVAHGDEWALAGWHGAGNTLPERKAASSYRHALNEAMRQCPQVVIFGRHEEAPTELAAQACHAAGFRVFFAEGRGVDGVWTFCADLPDSLPVKVLGHAHQLGQLRQLGCEADGFDLAVSALCTFPHVGEKTAEAIVAEAESEGCTPRDLIARAVWLPKVRGASRVRVAMTPEGYDVALANLTLRRVEIREITGERGPTALRELGLGHLADRIEESELYADRG